MKNFRILRRCEGIAFDETVTKLLLTTGSLETQKKFLGSAQKNRVGRVTLNKVFFFFGLSVVLHPRTNLSMDWIPARGFVVDLLFVKSLRDEQIV